MYAKTQFFRPELYRFMDEEYIDQFLKEGKFRLTALSKLRVLDNCRIDQHEGCYSQEIENEKMGVRVALQSDPTEKVYVLSASLSPYAVNPHRFKWCLKITNVEAFANALTQSLEENGYRVESVVDGPCNYSGRTEQLLVPQGSRDCKKQTRYIDNLLKIARGFAMFQKTCDYMGEHEYRIVWSVKERRINDYVYLTNIKDSNLYAEKVKVPQNKAMALHNNVIKQCCNRIVNCCYRAKRICGNLIYAVMSSVFQNSQT